MASPEELDLAHASLRKDLQALQDVVSADCDATPLRMGNRLAMARTQVTEHFAWEESNGWATAILQQEPRLEHAVRHLLQEHRELTQSLDTLIDEAAAIQHADKPFREKVLRWIERVRDHEARENELLEEAFEEDLGAGD
jgi:hypothetical protein